MKLFLSLLMSIFCVTANASTVKGLKEIADDLNYSLTVEWDQKDKEFYANSIENFTSDFKQLIDNGLTLNEVREFARQEVKDDKVLSEFEATLNAIQTHGANAEELANKFQNIVKGMYSNGASWTGERLTPTVFLFLMVFIFVVSSIGTITPFSPEYYSSDL